MYDRRPAATAASAVPTVPKPDAATLGSFQLAIVILHHRPEHSDRGDNIGVFRRAFKRNRISRPAGAAGGGVAAAKGYAWRHHVRPAPVRLPAPAASSPPPVDRDVDRDRGGALGARRHGAPRSEMGPE